MARLYYPVWKRLAANETVTLTCHAGKETTIRNALYMEKWRQKTNRDVSEQPSYGRLSISSEQMKDKPGYVRLVITLSYSGDNL